MNMKRFTTIVLLVSFALSLCAQGFRAYLQVTYAPIPRTATIMVGDSVIIPKDSKGQPLKFNTAVAVLNWLSKKGWRLEPIHVNSQQVQTFMMSRDNTTEKEIGAMFNK